MAYLLLLVPIYLLQKVLKEEGAVEERKDEEVDGKEEGDV